MENRPVKTIAKAAAIFLFGTVLAKLLTYIFRLVIARTGVENYGLLSIALAIFGVISVVCVFGMDTGLYGLISSSLKQEEKERVKRFIKSASKLSLALSLMLSFLLFILSDFIAIAFFHTEELSLILKIIAIAIPFGVMRTIFQMALRAFQLIKYDTITRIAENILKLILTIIFLGMGYAVFGITWAYTISIFASFILSIFYFQRKVFTVFTTKVKAKLINKELLVYSWPLLLNSISMIILTWTDTLMIGFFRGVTEVGLYNTAAPTANLISLLTKSIMAVFLPVTAALYLGNQKKQLENTYKTTIRWIFLINSFPVLLFVLFPREILSLFFGQSYGQAYPSLIILSIFFCISSLTDVPRDILLMHKKTKTIFHITLIGVIANVILNLFLIPPYGYNGAALATGASFLITTILFFSVARSKANVHFFDATYLKMLLSMLIIAALTIIVKSQIPSMDTATFILLAIAAVALHGLVLLLLNCFKKEELMIIKAGIRKIRSRK